MRDILGPYNLLLFERTHTNSTTTSSTSFTTLSTSTVNNPTAAEERLACRCSSGCGTWQRDCTLPLSLRSEAICCCLYGSVSAVREGVMPIAAGRVFHGRRGYKVGSVTICRGSPLHAHRNSGILIKPLSCRLSAHGPQFFSGAGVSLRGI